MSSRDVGEVLHTMPDEGVSLSNVTAKRIILMAKSGSTATGTSDVERPPVAARPSYGRQYSNSNRFFGESRVTPRGTPRGTPSASRRSSKHY